MYIGPSVFWREVWVALGLGSYVKKPDVICGPTMNEPSCTCTIENNINADNRTSMQLKACTWGLNRRTETKPQAPKHGNRTSLISEATP